MRTYPVHRRRRFFTIALAGVLATASTVSAAEPIQPAPSAAEIQRQIKELQEQVDRLNRESREHEVAIDNQTRFPLAQWKDGFLIDSADNRFKLKIGAYTQFDSRIFVDDSPALNTNQFVSRRARLDIQGTVFKYFDFRILPDFGGSSVQLYDAYLDVNYIPQAKLRFGKFKPPVGLERLQSATSLMFIERGLPTNLVPSRDNGVQLFGDLFDGTLGYQLGLFNGVPDNVNPTSTDLNDDKDFAGRVFASPFSTTDISALKGLGLGVAGTFGHQRGSTSSPDVPTYKSFGQATFFSFNGADTTNKRGAVTAFGDRSRITPQAQYYFGSFGALLEYVYESQAFARDAKRATLNNSAWQIGASYLITGELASYKGITPFHAFEPIEGHWGPGAWEVAARYGEINIDRDAFPVFADPTKSAHRANEFVFGTNWYLNKNVKFVLNYAQSEFTNGAKKGNRPNEHAIETRVQLAF